MAKQLLIKTNLYNKIIEFKTSFIIIVAVQDLVTGNILYDNSINIITEIVRDTNSGIEIAILNPNEFNIICNQITSAIIKFSYQDTDNVIYSIYYSFQVIEPLNLPNSNDYLRIMNNELPENVFINDPLDTSAISQMIGNLYNEGLLVFTDAYPNLSTNLAWLKQLWSNSQSLFIDNPNINYSDIFVFLRNLNITCTLNPFDLAWHISKFIYLIHGSTYYVYVKETPNLAAPYYTIYILQKDLSTLVWILGESTLNVDTILGGQLISDVYQSTITFFGDKIIRASVSHKYDFDNDLPTVGLNTPITDTYKGDKRLNKTYCIIYNPLNFTNADAYIA